MTDELRVFGEELNKRISDSQLSFNESMSKHTTFRTGGNADIFVVPKKIDDIVTIVNLCKEHKVDYFVIGKGSNLLVSDDGYHGVIICIYGTLDEVRIEEISSCEDARANSYRVTAGAGMMLSKFANILAKNELEGFEFASGIPGTLGGAVAMNAGAYGGEIKDCIESAVVIDEDMNIITLSKEELALDYRSSIVKTKGYIVLEASFQFKKGEASCIQEKMNDFNGRRRDKQPLEFPSAGSTFKRPEGYFAGKLIQDCGLAGYRVGGACVSQKHCGFVVNDQGGTSLDVMTVIKDVQEKVMKEFGVELEPEVRFVGKF